MRQGNQMDIFLDQQVFFIGASPVAGIFLRSIITLAYFLQRSRYRHRF